jgi:hypothetical protein
MYTFRIGSTLSNMKYLKDDEKNNNNMNNDNDNIDISINYDEDDDDHGYDNSNDINHKQDNGIHENYNDTHKLSGYPIDVILPEG